MDVFSAEQRSRIMSRIRSSRNNSTELRLIRIMRRNRIIGWRRGSPLPGKPDFVFKRERVAVFVDGDFWHGNPQRFCMPKSHTQYWHAKILGNKLRDRRVSRALRAQGWAVLRFWESQLRDEVLIIKKLKAKLG
ncbi:MAG: very short patch repair endonuclease [Acidobacteria bacterium]|nr:MAG: very short patch repair endonuclease [Acidobacteriota bacterium]